jgi:hypothetical protein
MDVLFEIEPKDLTLEELAKQEAEAVAKLEKLRSAITEAQTKKRETDLHKLTTIVKQLHEEYGEDFVEVVKKEIKFKAKKVALSNAEKEEHKKFLHLFNRGYKGREGKTFNHLEVEVKSNIPAQKTFIPQFSMSPAVYARLYEKYNDM